MSLLGPCKTLLAEEVWSLFPWLEPSCQGGERKGGAWGWRCRPCPVAQHTAFAKLKPPSPPARRWLFQKNQLELQRRKCLLFVRFLSVNFTVNFIVKIKWPPVILSDFMFYIGQNKNKNTLLKDTAKYSSYVLILSSLSGVSLYSFAGIRLSIQ